MWQHLILESETCRALLLLMPVALWIGLFLSRKFSDKHNTGALFAFVWQVQSSLLLSTLLFPMDVEMLLGQSVLLGSVNYLVLMKRGLVAMALAALLFIGIFVALPWQQPLLFAAMFLVVIMPALALAVWTGEGTHVYLRSILQALCWACLLLWLFPSLMLFQTGSNWSAFLARPLWINCVYALPLIVPFVLLIGALYQFAREGNGTGFPYDPPQRLVTNGIYAYISNPMQTGICLMMLWWGVVIGSVWVSLSAIVSVFLFVVFKDICNGSCAIGRTDPDWLAYQQEVPRWLPRLTPWRLHKRCI
jgi:protein-S-isoprenylcysteine O-methyltransferase Ste14